MTETTRNHIFSKEISKVIIAAMGLAPNLRLKKLSASDISYERKSALAPVGTFNIWAWFDLGENDSSSKK